MPDNERIGDVNETNPNEATTEDGTQQINPGTGDPSEGTAGTTGLPGTNPPVGGGGDTSGTGR